MSEIAPTARIAAIEMMRNKGVRSEPPTIFLIREGMKFSYLTQTGSRPKDCRINGLVEAKGVSGELPNAKTNALAENCGRAVAYCNIKATSRKQNREVTKPVRCALCTSWFCAEDPRGCCNSVQFIPLSKRLR